MTKVTKKHLDQTNKKNCDQTNFFYQKKIVTQKEEKKNCDQTKKKHIVTKLKKTMKFFQGNFPDSRNVLKDAFS